jgi:hypothetical protein
MNRDILIGRDMAQTRKTVTYREFARFWQDETHWDRFDFEDGEIDMLRAFLIAVHGYQEAGGRIDFSDVPEDEE